MRKKTTCIKDIYKTKKFLPSVAPTERLLGDTSKNTKSRDTPHLAHNITRLLILILEAKSIRLWNYIVKLRCYKPFNTKKNSYTHTKQKMPMQHLCPPNTDIQEKKVK